MPITYFALPCIAITLKNNPYKSWNYNTLTNAFLITLQYLTLKFIIRLIYRALSSTHLSFDDLRPCSDLANGIVFNSTLFKYLIYFQKIINVGSPFLQWYNIYQAVKHPNYCTRRHVIGIIKYLYWYLAYFRFVKNLEV